MLTLPQSPDALTNAHWTDIEPYYRALLDFPLDSSTLREWLDAWSSLDEIVDEAYALSAIAYTANTADETREAAYLRWGMEIAPPLHEVSVLLGKRLVPFANELPDLGLMINDIKTDIAIFRSENLSRFAELQEMEAMYDKITGGLTVDWDGETKTIPALNPFLLEQDRAVRQRAFLATFDAYLAKRDELAALFDRMVKVRHALGREAGFDNYRDYTFVAKHRYNYTPDDCTRFHDAVEQEVLPAIARMHALRKQRLGLDRLRPWDLQVQPGGDHRLMPFSDIGELVGTTQRIFDEVDGTLGGFFRRMSDDKLLDLDSRIGKAPGGYCSTLAYRREPFIFMNAVGVHDDVNTLAHEAGHAFHAFLTSDIKYTWRRGTGHEAAELASMSMELIAAPHFAKPTGFYSPQDAARAQVEHLEDVLAALPHIACVDAFQHWIYTDGLDASPDERDAQWLRIRARFEPSVDFGGYERQRIARWYKQSHIHTVPFYYIEYGIAQLGALQVWQQSLTDPAGALGRYKQALTLGGTRSLPDIYAAANVKLVFDAPTMRTLVHAVERRLSELRPIADA